MALLAGISAVKLKKTTETRREADHMPLQMSICKDSTDYLRMMEETFFEKYWEDLKDVSFASSFISLDRDTAASLCSGHTTFINDTAHVKFKTSINLEEVELIELEYAGITDKIIHSSPLLFRLAASIQASAEEQV